MTTPAPTHSKRVVAVTGGLILSGAAVGGVCGLVASVGWIAMERGMSALAQVRLLDFAVMSAFGAVIGAIASPTVLWGVLRHVPLGRVLLVGVPATIIGAWLGDWVLPLTTSRGWLQGAFVGAALGFTGASILLRALAARQRMADSGASAG